jgi:hypothetical protein
LELKCKRINLFIGEPNTGKSNILEVIGLLSHVNHGYLKDGGFVRFEDLSNLFKDQNLEESIIIQFDDNILNIKYEHGSINGYCDLEGNRNIFNYDLTGSGSKNISNVYNIYEVFKFYKFIKLKSYDSTESKYLHPPYGNNLPQIIITRGLLKNILSKLLTTFGYTLMIELPERKIKIAKNLKDILVSIPYNLISDTLQRLVFYLSAIYSNKNSILSFEEPESHSFPFYTKYLAEIISQDKNNNQYFISTHNPYFLTSILEKTDLNEISVFVTYIDEYYTKVKELNKKEIEEILELDYAYFFNIDKYFHK